jgi:hypothetical protein
MTKRNCLGCACGRKAPISLLKTCLNRTTFEVTCLPMTELPAPRSWPLALSKRIFGRDRPPKGHGSFDSPARIDAGHARRFEGLTQSWRSIRTVRLQ